MKAGETVIVFERDRPIARIEQITSHEDPSGRVARLGASGLVRGPLRPLPLDVLRAPAPASRASVLQALLEERAEER